MIWIQVSFYIPGGGFQGKLNLFWILPIDPRNRIMRLTTYKGEGRTMKIKRLVAQIFVVAFLVSLSGIVGAEIMPDKGAQCTIDGNNLKLDTGGATFTLSKDQTMKVTHAGKTWTLTAKADTRGHVKVLSDDTLEFAYDKDKLALVAPGAIGGAGASSVAGGAAAGAGGSPMAAAGAVAATAAGIGAGAGVGVANQNHSAQ